eukprot:PhF_6_TR27210/c0_g1_i3/m.40033
MTEDVTTNIRQVVIEILPGGCMNNGQLQVQGSIAVSVSTAVANQVILTPRNGATTIKASEFNAVMNEIFYYTCQSTTPRLFRNEFKYSYWPLGVQYFAVTNHFYLQTNSAVFWNEANQACNGLQQIFGIRPYMATVTSREENDAMGNWAGWLCGTDDGHEGRWTWECGPEAGQNFGYSNWAPNEPNDSGGEWNVHRYSWGTWNDQAGYDKPGFFGIGGVTGHRDFAICEYGSPNEGYGYEGTITSNVRIVTATVTPENPLFTRTHTLSITHPRTLTKTTDLTLTMTHPTVTLLDTITISHTHTLTDDEYSPTVTVTETNPYTDTLTLEPTPTHTHSKTMSWSSTSTFERTNSLFTATESDDFTISTSNTETLTRPRTPSHTHTVTDDITDSLTVPETITSTLTRTFSRTFSLTKPTVSQTNLHTITTTATDTISRTFKTITFERTLSRTNTFSLTEVDTFTRTFTMTASDPTRTISHDRTGTPWTSTFTQDLTRTTTRTITMDKSWSRTRSTTPDPSFDKSPTPSRTRSQDSSLTRTRTIELSLTTSITANETFTPTVTETHQLTLTNTTTKTNDRTASVTRTMSKSLTDTDTSTISLPCFHYISLMTPRFLEEDIQSNDDDYFRTIEFELNCNGWTSLEEVAKYFPRALSCHNSTPSCSLNWMKSILFPENVTSHYTIDFRWLRVLIPMIPEYQTLGERWQVKMGPGLVREPVLLNYNSTYHTITVQGNTQLQEMVDVAHEAEKMAQVLGPLAGTFSGVGQQSSQTQEMTAFMGCNSAEQRAFEKSAKKVIIPMPFLDAAIEDELLRYVVSNNLAAFFIGTGMTVIVLLVNGLMKPGQIRIIASIVNYPNCCLAFAVVVHSLIVRDSYRLVGRCGTSDTLSCIVGSVCFFIWGFVSSTSIWYFHHYHYSGEFRLYAPVMPKGWSWIYFQGAWGPNAMYMRYAALAANYRSTRYTCCVLPIAHTSLVAMLVGETRLADCSTRYFLLAIAHFAFSLIHLAYVKPLRWWLMNKATFLNFFLLGIQMMLLGVSERNNFMWMRIWAIIVQIINQFVTSIYQLIVLVATLSEILFFRTKIWPDETFEIQWIWKKDKIPDEPSLEPDGKAPTKFCELELPMLGSPAEDVIPLEPHRPVKSKEVKYARFEAVADHYDFSTNQYNEGVAIEMEEKKSISSNSNHVVQQPSNHNPYQELPSVLGVQSQYNGFELAVPDNVKRFVLNQQQQQQSPMLTTESLHHGNANAMLLRSSGRSGVEATRDTPSQYVPQRSNPNHNTSGASDRRNRFNQMNLKTFYL